MERFEHGGDIYSHEGVVDFSASINPLGMPPAAKRALIENVGAYEAYPDTHCRELRSAIARAEGATCKQIVCTAGVTDLLHRICQVLKPRHALVTAPCFSGYEQALERAGSQVMRHPLIEGDGFDLTESVLGFSCLPTAPDAVFLCNPNNPTGLTIKRALLIRILDEARAAGIHVILDECFLDFTDEPSAVPLCNGYPNLIVMRAFTKMHAMAGLRLGYGICSDEQLVRDLADCGQPWAVSVPAQLAGVAALADEQWAQRTRAYVAAEREKLARGLEELGLIVVPGKANYLLFKSERPVYAPLLQRGFLIRRCENFNNLDARWYRIAVRNAQENARFIEAIGAVLEEGQR